MKSTQQNKGGFQAPLNPKDAATETEGCRHTNPGICANNSLSNVCAFVREDGMCLKPPKSWPKQYKLLKGGIQ